MILQNTAKIRCFLPSVRAIETPEKAAEKTKKKVGNPLTGSHQKTGCPNKKKVGNPIGDPVGGWDAPINTDPWP